MDGTRERPAIRLALPDPSLILRRRHPGASSTFVGFGARAVRSLVLGRDLGFGGVLGRFFFCSAASSRLALRVRSRVVLLPGTRGLNRGARARGPLALARVTPHDERARTGPRATRTPRAGEAPRSAGRNSSATRENPPFPHLLSGNISLSTTCLHHPSYRALLLLSLFWPRATGLSPLRRRVELRDPSRAARRSKREVRARALALLFACLLG
jgi:hypothetical protein